MTSTRLAERPRSTPRLRLRGDEDDLYRRHHRTLVKLTRRKVSAPEELIEDACQFAWLTLCRKQPERDNIVGWLVVVARHEAYRLARDYKRTRPASCVANTDEHGRTSEFDPDQVQGPERDLIAGLEARGAIEQLAGLRPAQRQTLSLKAAGFSYKEIQEICGGKTYTWVNRHITEGRAALRALALSGR